MCAIGPASERSHVLDAAMTSQDRPYAMTRAEMRLLLAIEEVKMAARALGINAQEVSDRSASTRLRAEAFLWRSSKWLPRK